jgi:tetratricopeptide (TPR) repeat protein
LFVLFAILGTFAQSRTNQSGTGGIHEVRGKLYLPSGQSFETPVEIELRGVFTSLKVFTDRAGSFVFQNLSPGSYTLTVNAGEQFEPASEYIIIDPEVPPPRGIAVMRPSPKLITVPINLRLKRGIVLRNEVINAKWASVSKDAIEHFKRGIELSQDNKMAEAEVELRRAIDLAPKFAPAHTELGKVLLQRGSLDSSIEAFRTAIRHDQADFDAHLNLGVAFLNLRKYDQAEPELVTAAYLNRSAVTPHYYLGIVFVMKNDLDVAQKAFETAKELKGGRSLPAIHKYLGRIYMKKDMGKEAVEELETYLKLAPKAPDAEKVRKDISEIKAKSVKNAFV